MQNVSEKPSLKIFSAAAMLKDMWGIELNPDLFLEWANDGVRRIGYNIDKIKVKGKVQEGGYINLPCEATKILAVTKDYDAFSRWKALAIGEDGVVTTDHMGTLATDLSNDIDVLHGDLVDFEVVSSSLLRVAEHLETEDLYALVHAKITDEEGLPMISHKQAAAVADWCAFVYTRRNAAAGIKGLDLGYMQQVAERAIAQARIPESISDNELDEVLDAKTSHGRKHFNRNHSWGK